MTKVLVEVDLDIFESLDYVGKADYLIGLVKKAQEKREKKHELSHS